MTEKVKKTTDEHVERKVIDKDVEADNAKSSKTPWYSKDSKIELHDIDNY